MIWRKGTKWRRNKWTSSEVSKPTAEWRSGTKVQPTVAMSWSTERLARQARAGASGEEGLHSPKGPGISLKSMKKMYDWLYDPVSLLGIHPRELKTYISTDGHTSVIHCSQNVETAHRFRWWRDLQKGISIQWNIMQHPQNRNAITYKMEDSWKHYAK